MTIFRASAVVQSTDRQNALYRYEQLFSAHPIDEFHISGRDLVVSVFPGFSVLSGSPEALAGVRDLRATLFVDSLNEIEELLVETGWTREGTLGSKGNMLARDPDGNLIEFVEEAPGNRGGHEPTERDPPGSSREKIVSETRSVIQDLH